MLVAPAVATTQATDGPKAMRIFTLHSRVSLPKPLEEVFAFFAEARNLEELTPPWLKFEILAPGPIKMQAGARIDYRLRLRGIPIRWQSEITAWEPPQRFIDIQRRGPYRLWEHEHRFIAEGATTIAEDSVRYGVPGGWLADQLFVRRDLARVFAYRRAKLEQIFCEIAGTRGPR